MPRSGVVRCNGLMETAGTSIGSYAPDFELPGVDGAVHHLAQYLRRHRAVGIVVMGNHCPYVQRYLDRLKQLQRSFQAQGATLVGINANADWLVPEDSFENMKAFASTHQLNFPYLRDMTQDVAQSLGAQRTPEAFLVDQAGVLRYSGAIDDSPDVPDAVNTSYLYRALTQLLAHQPIAPDTTEAIGSSIKWRV